MRLDMYMNTDIYEAVKGWADNNGISPNQAIELLLMKVLRLAEKDGNIVNQIEPEVDLTNLLWPVLRRLDIIEKRLKIE